MLCRGLPILLMSILWSGASSAQVPNDHFNGLIPLSGWTASSTVNPTGANLNFSDPMAAAFEPVSLWWSYTPPSDGEVSLNVTDLAPPIPGTNYPLQNDQGFEVYVYDELPHPTGIRGWANFFDDHWGGLRTGENAQRLNAVDLRFAGKAGTTYYIEIGTMPSRTLPFTVKAATSVGTTSWYWRSDHLGGTGYAIEMRGGNVFAGFFLYNDDGTPNWLVASGPLVNGSHFSAPLQQYGGGQPIQSAQQPDQAGHVIGSPGTVTIDWTGPCHATMTWPGGTVPIDCYLFDSSAGFLNSGKPRGYHDTGWYWLPEDGGGRGLFGQAQGGTEFWAIFDYDANGKASWKVATVDGLPTSVSFDPPYGGAPAQWESNCMAPVHTDPTTDQSYFFAHPLMSYQGGESMNGAWQSPMAAIAGYAAVICSSDFFDSVSIAGYSTLGGNQYLGPSTSLGGTDLMLSGIADNATLYDASENALLQPTQSLSSSAYSALCADTGGQCHWTRFQF